MYRQKVSRIWSSLAVSSVIAVVALSSPALASSGAISHTGPDSSQSIQFLNTVECSQENNNNLNIRNDASQQARSGNVAMDGNTQGGSGWSQWDPALWAAQGYTYDEWESAFNDYKASLSSSWGAHSGGSVSSGNASNNNSVSFGIAITNGATQGVCGATSTDTETPTNPPSTTQQPTTLVQGARNASNATKLTGTGSGASGNGGSLTSGSARDTGRLQNPVSNASSGGTGGSGGNNPVDPSDPILPTSHVEITETGPDSSNEVTINNTLSYQATNNNIVQFINSSQESSESGNVTASDNTTVGGASSGSTTNGSGVDGGVGISN